MPEINTYQQQYLPQGSYNSQSTPDQMGAGIGQAISELGETFQRIENDKGEVWAYKASSEAYLDLKKKYNDEISALDPRDPEYTIKLNNTTANFKSQIDQTSASLMEQAPSGYARKALERQMLQNSRSLMGEAVQRQASVVAEYTKAQLDDSVLLDMQSLDMDPSDSNFNRILQNRRDQIASLKNLSPELKIKWGADYARDLAKTQVLKLAQSDPFFLQKINPAGGKVGAANYGGDGTSFGNAMAFILKKEGGYTASDGESGAPANFGINQRANPDIDVKNLTQDRAVQIYKERYWSAIGADKLSSGMAMVAFNVAVNQGVGAAKDLLEKSGGDPMVFTTLAKQRYMEIASNNPKQQKYLAGWLTRADEALAAASAPRSILPQVKMLPDEEIASSNPPIAGWSLLTPQERWAAVRQAEGVASQKLAVARGELQNDLADLKTTLLDGKEYPGIDDGRFTLQNLVEKFGEETGKRQYEEIQHFKQVGSFAAQMKIMPAEQARQFLATLEPKAGEGYADKIQSFNAARQAYANIEKTRGQDYMEWALNTSGTNVKPIDFTSPQKLRETMVARIPAAIAGRQDYGVDTGVFSKNEVDAFGSLMNRLSPQDQIAYLREMRNATVGKDAWYVKAMSQLQPKVGALATAGNIAIKPGSVETSAGKRNGEMVAQMIAEGAYIRRSKDLGDPTKSITPIDFNYKDLRSYFWSAVGENAFVMPDGRFADQMAEQTLEAVANYVASSMYRSGDVSGVSRKQVKDAVKAVTGGSYSVNNSNLFLPWGMSEETFEKQFPAAFNSAIEANGLKGKIPASYDSFDYANVGDGKYVLLDPASKRVVAGAKGNVVITVTPPTNQAAR